MRQIIRGKYFKASANLHVYLVVHCLMLPCADKSVTSFFKGPRQIILRKLIIFSEQFQTFYGISQWFCFLLLCQYPHRFLPLGLGFFGASPALLLPDTFLLSRPLPLPPQCLSLVRPSLGNSSLLFLAQLGLNLVQTVVVHSKACILYQMSLFPTSWPKSGALIRWWPSSLPTTPIWYQKLLAATWCLWDN